MDSRAAKYRHRAEELRTLAEAMHDATACNSLLSIANQYEVMAENIEGRKHPKVDLNRTGR